VIFVDYWLMKRFNLQPFFAEKNRIDFNWAAGLTWFLTLATCLFLVKFAGIQIYFVSFPGWFVAAVLYITLSWGYQKRRAYLMA